MLRSLRRCIVRRNCAQILVPKCTFLTNEYKCDEAWNVQISSPILSKVNLNDFYNILDQNFLSKGVISAIDVDIFANAVRDPAYLDELKDLLHKLRLSAETGWLFYKKYDKLLSLCKELVENKTFKLYPEVVELINKEIETQQDDTKTILTQCIGVLSKAVVTETILEDSLKIAIENAINRTQNKDIAVQKQLFLNWEQIREDKLEEQSKRLDRANRMKNIVEKQKQMQVEEQKLWFFENEEDIDLQIEEKEKLVDPASVKKVAQQKDDENYIPPEILPKRK
ncbi:jg8161 [Pararge aegeria aegeria]|uniref:Jg8161 protein n=1 Tax=Pararge aegeria aegeria TaxID=348720 RepID=A0A8S4SLK0_9NEOP|nr:jg8161 [Pararge aegeria aegeria]